MSDLNKYAEVYDWVRRQPSVSDDFVSVPVESLAELLHIEFPAEQPTKEKV